MVLIILFSKADGIFRPDCGGKRIVADRGEVCVRPRRQGSASFSASQGAPREIVTGINRILGEDSLSAN